MRVAISIGSDLMKSVFCKSLASKAESVAETTFSSRLILRFSTSRESCLTEPFFFPYHFLIFCILMFIR